MKPRPVILPAPTKDSLPFHNCEGTVAHLNGKARIEDLAREGIKFTLVPIDEPLPKDPTLYVNTP